MSIECGILRQFSAMMHKIGFTNNVEPVANVRLLSLKEAENLLYSGCVFGMHSCPLCMAKQSEVDFHNYDYVDVRYVNGVPFYAFLNPRQF